MKQRRNQNVALKNDIFSILPEEVIQYIISQLFVDNDPKKIERNFNNLAATSKTIRKISHHHPFYPSSEEEKRCEIVEEYIKTEPSFFLKYIVGTAAGAISLTIGNVFISVFAACGLDTLFPDYILARLGFSILVTNAILGSFLIMHQCVDTSHKTEVQEKDLKNSYLKLSIFKLPQTQNDLTLENRLGNKL